MKFSQKPDIISLRRPGFHDVFYKFTENLIQKVCKFNNTDVLEEKTEGEQGRDGNKDVEKEEKEEREEEKEKSQEACRKRSKSGNRE